MTAPTMEAPPAAAPLAAPAADATWSRSRSNVVTGGAILLAVVLAALVISGVLTNRALVAVVAIGLMLTLMSLRVPIAAAMGIAGLIGLWRIDGASTVERSLIDLPFASAASWSLSVIPMFVLMGLLLWRSGATTRIYDAARVWFNWLPGGLAITTNMSGSGLAAASGSTIGITYALGRIGIPEMLKSGYDKRLTLGSVIMAGLPGQLIPPSLLLVVYAGIANLPVGPQLLSGVVPGLVLATVVNGAIIVLALAFPRIAPRDTTPITWAERWRAAGRVWTMPALILIVLWGLYGGLFTATEAAAVGCAGALLITAAYVRGREFWRAVGDALTGTVAAVGSVFFLLIGAAFINRLMAVSGIPAMFTKAVEDWGLSAAQFAVAAILVIVLLGMFMDPISVMLISIPIMLPTLNVLDVDLVWFGVLMVISAEVGMLTPPVGVLVFLLHKIAQDPQVNQGQSMSLGAVFQAALIGLPIPFLVMALLFLFPELATWLPATGAATE